MFTLPCNGGFRGVKLKTCLEVRLLPSRIIAELMKV